MPPYPPTPIRGFTTPPLGYVDAEGRAMDIIIMGVATFGLCHYIFYKAVERMGDM